MVESLSLFLMSFARWKNVRWEGYKFVEIPEEEDQAFVTSEQKTIVLTSTQLKIPNESPLDIWKVFINHNASQKKTVKLELPSNPNIRRKSWAGPFKQADLSLEFGNQQTAREFETALANAQISAINHMLDSLVDEHSPIQTK